MTEINKMATGQISIHALLAESDAYGRINDISRLIFLSTLSLRRATAARVNTGMRHQNFYPRSPCGERRLTPGMPTEPCAISIHALLAESDLPTGNASTAGGVFLSTLSLRRATTQSLLICAALKYFYPRSPCGERRDKGT